MTSLPVLWQMTLCRLGRTLDLTEGEEQTSTSLWRWSAYQAKEEFWIPFESNFNYSKRGEETLIWWRFCLCSLKPALPFCGARWLIIHTCLKKKREKYKNRQLSLLQPLSLSVTTLSLLSKCVSDYQKTTYITDSETWKSHIWRRLWNGVVFEA